MLYIPKNHLIKISSIFSWYKTLVKGKISSSNILLEELPIINQNILMDYYYTKNTLFSDSLIYKTSGTSNGLRKNIHYSREDHNFYLNHREKIFRQFLKSGYKVACSDLGTGHAADSATKIFEILGMKAYQINFDLPLERHIEILNKVQPDILFTMPMILKKLIHSNELKINPKTIFLVGDIATKTWQEDLSKYFSIKKENIIDLFGSIEIGSIAFFNHAISMYQFEDHILPEVINENGHSILLLTSTARTYFPAIRYKTDDILKNFSSLNLNGKNIWVFESVEGRYGLDFKVGEKISFYDITSCLDQVIPNIPFNIIETEFTLEILIPEEVNNVQVNKIKSLLRAINPDVGMMIISGLVEDFRVKRVHISQIDISHFKQKIQSQYSRIKE